MGEVDFFRFDVLAGGRGQGEGDQVERGLAGRSSKRTDPGMSFSLIFITRACHQSLLLQDKTNISNVFGVNTSVNTSYASPKPAKLKEPKEKKKSLFAKKEVKKGLKNCFKMSISSEPCNCIEPKYRGGTHRFHNAYRIKP